MATPDTRERNWLVVDATGQTLGRLATQIADALRGKRKPEYTPHIDTGDFVIVVNAEKIAVTGNKLAEKRYYRHSGYPGGLRSRTLRRCSTAGRRRSSAWPSRACCRAIASAAPAAQAQGVRGTRASHAAQKPEPMEVLA